LLQMKENSLLAIHMLSLPYASSTKKLPLLFSLPNRCTSSKVGNGLAARAPNQRLCQRCLAYSCCSRTLRCILNLSLHPLPVRKLVNKGKLLAQVSGLIQTPIFNIYVKFLFRWAVHRLISLGGHAGPGQEA